MVELLEDEKHVLYALSQYGPLLIPQLHKLLYDKTSSQQQRIVKNLKKFHYAYFVEGGRYLGPDPIGKPDSKNVIAVWVLLKFIEKIEPTGHFAAALPSQIFFLKEDTGYEIIVINDGEEHLLRSIIPKKKTKYIIVLPDIRMADILELPDAPCLFATVRHTGEKEPEVTFYTEEETEE